jgi:hypothetical protein
MPSTNNNDYDCTDRERKVIGLYDQGKSTRDIAKELTMSLRDIIIVLRKDHVSHGNVITNDNVNSDDINSQEYPNKTFVVISVVPYRQTR